MGKMDMDRRCLRMIPIIENRSAASSALQVRACPNLEKDFPSLICGLLSSATQRVICSSHPSYILSASSSSSLILIIHSPSSLLISRLLNLSTIPISQIVLPHAVSVKMYSRTLRGLFVLLLFIVAVVAYPVSWRQQKRLMDEIADNLCVRPA
jgi:hypothetical protein